MKERRCKDPNYLEGTENGHLCRCHKLMGNDFYFLPRKVCLYGDPLTVTTDTVPTPSNG